MLASERPHIHTIHPSDTDSIGSSEVPGEDLPFWVLQRERPSVSVKSRVSGRSRQSQSAPLARANFALAQHGVSPISIARASRAEEGEGGQQLCDALSTADAVLRLADSAAATRIALQRALDFQALQSADNAVLEQRVARLRKELADQSRETVTARELRRQADDAYKAAIAKCRVTERELKTVRNDYLALLRKMNGGDHVLISSVGMNPPYRRRISTPPGNRPPATSPRQCSSPTGLRRVSNTSSISSHASDHSLPYSPAYSPEYTQGSLHLIQEPSRPVTLDMIAPPRRISIASDATVTESISASARRLSLTSVATMTDSDLINTRDRENLLLSAGTMTDLILSMATTSVGTMTDLLSSATAVTMTEFEPVSASTMTDCIHVTSVATVTKDVLVDTTGTMTDLIPVIPLSCACTMTDLIPVSCADTMTDLIPPAPSSPAAPTFMTDLPLFLVTRSTSMATLHLQAAPSSARTADSIFFPDTNSFLLQESAPWEDNQEPALKHKLSWNQHTSMEATGTRAAAQLQHRYSQDDLAERYAGEWSSHEYLPNKFARRGSDDEEGKILEEEVRAFRRLRVLVALQSCVRKPLKRRVMA